jgi:hypothetical protein
MMMKKNYKNGQANEWMKFKYKIFNNEKRMARTGLLEKDRPDRWSDPSSTISSRPTTTTT